MTGREGNMPQNAKYKLFKNEEEKQKHEDFIKKLKDEIK